MNVLGASVFAAPIWAAARSIAVLGGMCTTVLTLPVMAQPVQPAYPAAHPLPSQPGTHAGGPKGRAKVLVEPCGNPPCTTAAVGVSVVDVDANLVMRVASSSKPDIDPMPTRYRGALGDAVARIDRVRGGYAVTATFCVARPAEENEPAQVRVSLEQWRSGDDAQKRYRQDKNAVEVRYLWETVDKSTDGQVRNCHLAAQRYRAFPERLILRGLPPRKENGVTITNSLVLEFALNEDPLSPPTAK